MPWRRNRADKPPRVGLRVFLQALAGVFVIFVATGAGVAGAGYFQIPSLEPPEDGGNGVEPPIQIP